MAKKIAVPDEHAVDQNGRIKARKKHNKCCTCCLIALVVVLVILVAAFVVGWILGDKYTKKYFGLSMGDTFGVVNDLYWTDDDDVVKRKFSQKDLNGFYSEIKRNILLKDDADIDFDSALQKAIDKYIGGGTTAAGLNASADSGDGGEKTDDQNEIIDIFVDMIADVLNRDNIDIERLNRYDADDVSTDEYIFELHDKQLAAFVNSVLKSVLKNSDKIDSLKSVSEIVDISKSVALKQIRFKATKLPANGDSGVQLKAASADITVWIGLQSAANGAIKKYMSQAGFGWAGGFVGWLGNVILPENLYLTLNIPLYGDGNSSIVINDMNAKERVRAEKLINGVLKLSNSDKTLDGFMTEFTDQIKPMLEKATEKMDFTDAGKGKITLDLLDTVAKMASKEMEGELTKADFLYVLQALFSDKTEQMNSLIPYRYDNWYLVNNKEVFMPTGGDPEKRIDYEKRFVEEIEAKYAIDFGDSATLTDVLKMLGVSLDGSENESSGSTDILDMVDSAAFDALLNERDINNIKLHVTDKMLGAALSSQMDTLLKGTEGMENINATLVALTFVKKDMPGKSDHLYAMLAVDIDLADMLASLLGDEDSLITKLTKGLMPEDMLLTVTVDITRDRSVKRDAAEFVLNSCQNTDHALATIEKLVPDLKLSEISDKIGSMLNNMLDEMDGKLNIDLQEATVVFDKELDEFIGEQGALIMPDMFTVVAETVLVQKNDDGSTRPVVSSEQLQSVIRGLNNPATFTPNVPTGKYEHFIDDVFLKYYLEEPEQPVKDFEELTAYMQDFGVGKLRVYGKNGIAHDNTAIADLHPVMSSDELLILLKENMQGNATIDAYNIVDVEIGDNTLAVTLSIGLSDLLKDAGAVQKLIKAKELYATATFHTDRVRGSGTEGDPFGYEVELDINIKDNGENTVMDGDTYAAMLEIVRLFAPEFHIEQQVSEFGVILYEQMQSLNNSIGGSADTQMFTFTANGLQLPDFYTFLALKMHPELLDTYEAKDIKHTLQGLYAVSDDPDEFNENNFSVDDIMINPPSPEVDPHTVNGSTRWTDEEAADLYGNTFVDIDFNGFLKRGVEAIAEDGAITVEQTMILAEGDDRPRVNAVRDWLNNKLVLAENDDIDLNADYFVVTFSMSMGSFVGGDGEGDNNASAIFPTKIYATVVYRYDVGAPAGERFSVVGGDRGGSVPVLVFNNMDGTQYDIMITLMGATPDSSDPNKVNINSMVQEGVTVLNGMSHMEVKNPITQEPITMDTEIVFAKTTDDNGMGKIFISKPTFGGPTFGGL